MATDERLNKVTALLERACDALHIAAAAIRDKELPKLADAVGEQAIMLTDILASFAGQSA